MATQSEKGGRPDNVTLIAIYYFVVGGLGLFGALAIVLLAIVPVVLVVQDPVGLNVSLAALGLGMITAGAFGIASVVVGFGLLRLRSWARWAAIVLAILGLCGFPIGTVIGALILIYLLGDEARLVFEGE